MTAYVRKSSREPLKMKTQAQAPIYVALSAKDFDSPGLIQLAYLVKYPRVVGTSRITSTLKEQVLAPQLPNSTKMKQYSPTHKHSTQSDGRIPPRQCLLTSSLLERVPGRA